MECEAIPKITCEASQHNILDRKEDVEEIKGLQKEVSTTLSGAVKKRKDIEKHLQIAIAANGESLKKLMSLADNKLLATTNKKMGSFSTKKKLEEDVQLAKEEMTEAEKVWNELNGGSVVTTVQTHL